jgi:hypothetical protein
MMGSVEKTEGTGKLDRRSSTANPSDSPVNATESSSLEKDLNLSRLMGEEEPAADSPDNGHDEDVAEYDEEMNDSDGKIETSTITNDLNKSDDVPDEEPEEDADEEDDVKSMHEHQPDDEDEADEPKPEPQPDPVTPKTVKVRTEAPAIEYGEDGRRIIKVPETEVSDEECGFPASLRQYVLRGKAIPINKKTWTDIDIDGNDSILDCASQVVPLMIKKPNIFPPKPEPKQVESEVKSVKKEAEVEASAEESNKDDKEKAEVKAETKEESDDDQKQGQQNKATMLTISDFYKSNIGNFLIGIGLSRSKEWSHRDAIKQTQKLIRKEGELDEHMEDLRKQSKLYSECKTANSIFSFKMNKCHMCEFKSESQAVMDGHYAIPHVTNRKEYKCNYCLFLTRDARTIVYHFQTQHRKPCNIQIPPHLYECPTCNYESNQKAKALAHMAKCTKIFNEDKVQATLDPENEYPAITPKPITQEDIKMYEATLQALRPAILNPRMAVPYVPGLPRGLQNQIVTMHQNQVQQQRQKMGAKAFQAATRQASVGGSVGSQSNVAAALRTLQSGALSGLVNPQTAAALAATGSNGSNLLSNLNFAKNAAPQLYHMLQSGVHAQLVPIQQKILSQAAAAGATPQQLQQLKNRLPSSNSMMLNKSQSSKQSSTTVAVPGTKTVASNHNNSGTSRDAATNGGKAGTFVICEICDGYIKDLEQLRTHMQWIHKV